MIDPAPLLPPNQSESEGIPIIGVETTFEIMKIRWMQTSIPVYKSRLSPWTIIGEHAINAAVVAYLSNLW